MQIIHEANENIMKVWGFGKAKPAEYRLLTYLVAAETDDGTLLHNVVTGELIHFDSDEMKQLNSLPCEYATWMDELIKKHFIVRADIDDMKSIETIRSALRMMEDKKAITGYTVLPTTNCNARCFYCYEHGTKLINMSDETADELVDFIESHHGDEKVHISWFGGEPLVGKHQIDRICSALDNKGIEFYSTMISNGYLFDENLAKHAKESWHLTRIQITLDGTERIYNETKAYVNPCDSPYRKVLENIRHLKDNEIHVSIRLNIGLHNADDLMELVEELSECFQEKKHLSVYSHILFDDYGIDPVHFDNAELSLIEDKKERLNTLIKEHDLSSRSGKLPKLKCQCCMADNDSSVLVLPSGMLGKCEHYSDSHYTGSIATGITDTDEIKLFKETVIHPQCKRCSLFPSCIKLKMCDARGCLGVEVRERIEKIKQSMLIRYADYLCGENIESADADTADC